MLANDMIKGLIPNDERWIGELIENVSYGNAKQYFGI
jgi:glucuronate isomerase